VFGALYGGGYGGTVRLTSPGTAVPAADKQARLPAGQALAPRLALLAAVVGGLALAAAFPPLGIWPLAAGGPALLVVALWRQRLRIALAAGAVFGIAFFFPLLSWLVNVAWYVWAALAVTETIIFAVLAAGQWLMLRLRAWPVWVAGWWVTVEAVRDRWPWGFPWGRLVMSQAQAPTAGWVAIGGPPFLTFLLALTGACLAWLVLALTHGQAARPQRDGRWEPRAWQLPAVVFAAAAAVAMSGAFLPAGRVAAGAPTAVVAAVQGNVPHTRNLPNLLRATTVTQNHRVATERLAARIRRGEAAVPDLVIWPENSTDQDPRFNLYIYDTIAAAVSDIGKPVLVGAVLQQPVRNAGVLWLPRTGPSTTYVKRMLVPFGEVIPFRGFLETFTSLPSLQPVNFTPGHRAVIFRVGRIRLGDVICYEVGFDGLVSSEVAAGATLLSVQTNDADFELDGQTGETLQQLAMARIRALEYDRAVVVASTTGVSAIIAPDGSLVTSTRTWRAAEIEAAVPLLTTTTLAQRAGGWPEGLLTFGTVAVFGWALLQTVARRRRIDHQTRSQAAE
jgi:apolipoprotein N-acyltransferase